MLTSIVLTVFATVVSASPVRIRSLFTVTETHFNMPKVRLPVIDLLCCLVLTYFSHSPRAALSTLKGWLSGPWDHSMRHGREPYTARRVAHLKTTYSPGETSRVTCGIETIMRDSKRSWLNWEILGYSTRIIRLKAIRVIEQMTQRRNVGLERPISHFSTHQSPESGHTFKSTSTSHNCFSMLDRTTWGLILEGAWMSRAAYPLLKRLRISSSWGLLSTSSPRSVQSWKCLNVPKLTSTFQQHIIQL